MSAIDPVPAKNEVNDLAASLQARGHGVRGIHGGLSRNAGDSLRAFRERRTELLDARQ